MACAQVVDQVSKKTYECTMDAQEGVVTFLLEEMAQQLVKEHLLAFAILLQHGSCAPVCFDKGRAAVQAPF